MVLQIETCSVHGQNGEGSGLKEPVSSSEGSASSSRGCLLMYQNELDRDILLKPLRAEGELRFLSKCLSIQTPRYFEHGKFI